MAGKKEIRFSQGDITESAAEAIVNAANNDLQLGAGVAGAIRRKGGPAIQQECDAIGSIPVGAAAITGAGNLKSRFVIHAASMSLGGGASADSLRSSTAWSLRLAKDHGLGSIAFPAVGTGIAGFPVRDCAQIMLREAVAHLKGETSLQSVHFVLFDAGTLAAFEAVWKEMQAKGEGL